MSPLVYPSTRNSISSGDSSSPPRLRWIKSTVRIMSNLAYHPKGLKVKEGLCRPGTNRPFPDVSTSDFGQFPLNSRLYTLRPRHSGFATRFRAKLARERRDNIGSVLLERRLGTRAKREDCFAQRTQRAQRKALRGWGFGMIGGGFIWRPGLGRGQAAGSQARRARREAEGTGGRRGVRRWGRNAWVVRGCCGRATASAASVASAASPGSFGEGCKWFRLVRVGPPKWLRLVTGGGGVCRSEESCVGKECRC